MKSLALQRYFARIVRAMVVSTLGVGGGVALLVIIFFLTLKGDQNAFEIGVRSGMSLGIVFAVFFVAVLLPLDASARLFKGKGYEEIWELEQTRNIVVEGTIKEVMADCRQALLMVPNVTSVSDDAEHLLARASTGPSWRSPGEEMEVEINPISEHRWAMKCVSKSRSKNIVFDYAKNYENVETWQKNLKLVSSDQAVADQETVAIARRDNAAGGAGAASTQSNAVAERANGAASAASAERLAGAASAESAPAANVSSSETGQQPAAASAATSSRLIGEEDEDDPYADITEDYAGHPDEEPADKSEQTAGKSAEKPEDTPARLEGQSDNVENLKPEEA